MFENELTLLKKENDIQSFSVASDDWNIIKTVMQSMSVFKVNSYDREVIKRDLIGMAQEVRLRNSSLAVEIGDDLKGFSEEIVKNSSGPSKREIALNFIETLSKYFLLWFLIVAIGGYGNMASWLGNPMIIFPTYFGVALLSFISAEIITPLFITETGFKKFLPSIISFSLFVGFIAIMYLSRGENTGHVERAESLIFPTIIISLFIFLMTKYLNSKNIEKIAKNKRNFIEDLIH